MFTLLALQFSVQVAFATAYILYVLKDSLINTFELKWTDALEAVYKMLCKCGSVIPVSTYHYSSSSSSRTGTGTGIKMLVLELF